MRIRENLQEAAEDRVNADYADEVLERIVGNATFAYPEALVHDQIHHLLDHLDRDLRQRGLTLEDFMKVSGKSHEDLHVDYRDNAIQVIQRSLAIQELIDKEAISVADDEVEGEIDRISSQFGAQAQAFRSIYNNEAMRENLRRDLMNRRIMERVAQIAKGEEVPVPAAVSENEPVSEEPNEGDSE
jgi:trigger factor